MQRFDKWHLLIVSLVVGASTFVIGLQFPVYSDDDRARELKFADCEPSGSYQNWFDQMAQLETWRYPLMQSGISIALTGITVCFLASRFARNERSKLLTPSSRITFFLLGLVVVALSFVSQVWSLMIDLERGALHPCADSIAIPFAGFMFFYPILLFICCLVGWVLTRNFKELPVPLFQWRRDNLLQSWTITIPFALISAFLLLVGLPSATSSAFAGTPAVIIALFLTEATRSALLAKPLAETP